MAKDLWGGTFFLLLPPQLLLEPEPYTLYGKLGAKGELGRPEGNPEMHLDTSPARPPLLVCLP